MRAATVALTGLLLAACSGGSGGTPATSPPISAPPSGQPSALRASTPPAGARDITTPATAVLTTASGGRWSLQTPPGGPADVYVTASGQVSLQIATTGPHGAAFNISGGAELGHPVTNDRVSATGPGLYLDSTYPDLARCTTTYSAASAASVAGTVTCRIFQPTAGTVTVAFHTG